MAAVLLDCLPPSGVPLLIIALQDGRTTGAKADVKLIRMLLYLLSYRMDIRFFLTGFSRKEDMPS